MMTNSILLTDDARQALAIVVIRQYFRDTAEAFSPLRHTSARVTPESWAPVRPRRAGANRRSRRQQG